MASVQEFRARFPEFSDPLQFEDDRIQMFLDDAAQDIDQAKFGDLYDRAHSYLAAHYLALGTGSEAGDAGNVGPIDSKSVDGVSVSYHNKDGDSDQISSIYNSTVYGQKYLMLVRRVCPGILTVC